MTWMRDGAKSAADRILAVKICCGLLFSLMIHFRNAPSFYGRERVSNRKMCFIDFLLNKHAC